MPQSIVDRPKHGFVAPIRVAAGAAGADGATSCCSTAALRDRGIFDDATRRAAVARAPRGAARDHRHRLWSLVMLELWFRQFVDGPHTGRAALTAA